MCKNFTLCLMMNLVANHPCNCNSKPEGIDNQNPLLNINNVVQIGNANTVGSSETNYTEDVRMIELEMIKRENELLRDMVKLLKNAG